MAKEIVDLVLRFACENPLWGFDRIQGALANLGHTISAQTVGNILKRHGIEPAPERKRTTTWATFLKAHWDVLASIDFTTVEVWTKGGLVTHYLLFVMELKTRRVHLAVWLACYVTTIAMLHSLCWHRRRCDNLARIENLIRVSGPVDWTSLPQMDFEPGSVGSLKRGYATLPVMRLKVKADDSKASDHLMLVIDLW